MSFKKVKIVFVLLFLLQFFCQTYQNDDSLSFDLNKRTIDVSNNIVNRIFAYKRRKDLPTFIEDIISSQNPFYRQRRINNYIDSIDIIYSIKVGGIKRSSKNKNLLMRKKIKFHPYDFDTLGGLGLGKRAIF